MREVIIKESERIRKVGGVCVSLCVWLGVWVCGVCERVHACVCMCVYCGTFVPWAGRLYCRRNPLSDKNIEINLKRKMGERERERERERGRERVGGERKRERDI